MNSPSISYYKPLKKQELSRKWLFAPYLKIIVQSSTVTHKRHILNVQFTAIPAKQYEFGKAMLKINQPQCNQKGETIAFGLAGYV